MQSTWLARGLGAALVLASGVLLALAPGTAGSVLAMGLAAIGLYVAVVVAERAVPAAAMQAAVRGEADLAHAVADGLRLEGNLHGVAGADGRAYLFLPARDEAGTVPPPEGGALHGGQDGHMAGLLVPCAATHLLREHAGATRAPWTGEGLPAGVASLRDLGRENDLWSRLDAHAEGDAIRVRLRPGAARPPCMDRPEGCLPVGCLLCHCVTLGVAQSLETPIRMASGQAEGGWVRLGLERVRP